MSLPNIFNIPNIKGNGHPTEKPVELMRLFVEQSSNENDIVFDPFMGIGTTGFACQKSNRKFIGIEIEQKYFDIACKRIEEASRQKDLFI
jgi:DNA modification methylase